jgi:hypothetical protein
MWRRVVQRAKKRRLACDLTVEWVLIRLRRGYCEQSYMPFDFRKPGHNHISPRAPSIDRKDNRLGYLQSNCQVVVYQVNVAKNRFTKETLVEMARAVLQAEAPQYLAPRHRFGRKQPPPPPAPQLSLWELMPAPVISISARDRPLRPARLAA